MYATEVRWWTRFDTSCRLRVLVISVGVMSCLWKYKLEFQLSWGRDMAWLVLRSSNILKYKDCTNIKHIFLVNNFTIYEQKVANEFRIHKKIYSLNLGLFNNSLKKLYVSLRFHAIGLRTSQVRCVSYLCRRFPKQLPRYLRWKNKSCRRSMPSYKLWGVQNNG